VILPLKVLAQVIKMETCVCCHSKWRWNMNPGWGSTARSLVHIGWRKATFLEKLTKTPSVRPRTLYFWEFLPAFDKAGFFSNDVKF